MEALDLLLGHTRQFIRGQQPQQGPTQVERIDYRTLLVEVQSLTSRCNQGYPARRTTGVDQNRLPILIAVLTQRCGMDLGYEEVFVNAVGGVEIDEPAVDLAVAGAIASAFRSRAVDARTCMVGEVGLAGEIRGVSQPDARVIEAARLGFERAIVPRDNMKALDKPDGMELIPVSHLSEALERVQIL